MKVTQTAQAPKAIGPYSQAITFEDFIFCSGQVPLNPDSMEMVAPDIETQTEQALKNLRAVLEASGSSLARVVKTTVFLKNFADFTRMNGVYERAFGDHKPARSTVEVSRLPKDALVEIECIAVRS